MQMDQTTKTNYIKAGKISAQALEYGKSLIKKNASLLDVTEKIEQKIFELGAKPAFPVQISCDHIAAHYCPLEDDKIIFDAQVACLDLGVHINGAVGDNAYTIDLSGKYAELIKSAQEALENALQIVKIGTEIREIGAIIQKTISGYGFAPVKNLSGHGLGIYDVHSKPTIPNYDNGDKTGVKDGMVFAIEPFATTGVGIVQEAGNATVFVLQNKKPVRSQITRDVLKEIGSYEGLPFTTRWLTRKFGAQAHFALRELSRLEIIKAYPPLVEVNKGIVSQAEHSVLVDDGEVVVLTKS